MAGTVKYGHFTAFGGLKLYPPLLKYMGIEGLIELKRKKEYTVSYSPFGWVDEGGTAFLKGAPVNKYVPESELASLGAVGRAIEGGLSKAKALSKSHREKGVAIVNIRGRLKRMPAKAARMMEAGKRKELIKGVPVIA